MKSLSMMMMTRLIRLYITPTFSAYNESECACLFVYRNTLGPAAFRSVTLPLIDLHASKLEINGDTRAVT
jgi:hypothetical protein